MCHTIFNKAVEKFRMSLYSVQLLHDTAAGEMRIRKGLEKPFRIEYLHLFNDNFARKLFNSTAVFICCTGCRFAGNIGEFSFFDKAQAGD